MKQIVDSCLCFDLFFNFCFPDVGLLNFASLFEKMSIRRVLGLSGLGIGLLGSLAFGPCAKKLKRQKLSGS